MYYYGHEVPQDYSKAVEWYRKSAGQSNDFAQYSLAYVYHKGLGVRQNIRKAVEWYRKAAEQGHKVAIENLKKMEKAGEIP